MQRNITVSIDVYAAIWADRKEGEDSEDAILRRKFKCSAKIKSASEKILMASNATKGVSDTRNNVNFPEGFEIFRTYKRQEYSAVATGGSWLRQDIGKRFQTLNQLNESIVAGPENVWNGNWKYRGPDGTVHSIDELRNK